MNYRFAGFIVACVAVGIGAAALLRCSATTGQNRGSATTALQEPTVAEPQSKDRAAHDFTYNHGRVAQRDLSADDKRYNPVLYAREDDLTPKEIFEREPKDATFAPILEQRIEKGYADAFKTLELEGKIKAIKADCRTLSCYTEIEVAKKDGDYVYDRINGAILGTMQMPGLVDGDTPDQARVTFYTLFDPELRDDQTFRDFMENGFSRIVGALKIEYATHP